MTQNNNIESTYGKPFSVSIANTSADVVMNAQGLPKSTMIVSSKYDETTMQDIGNQSIIMTDYQGQPFMLTYSVLETNGLHSVSNPNALSLNIDGTTLQTNSYGQLSFGIGALLDGTVLSESLNGLEVNSQFIEHATQSRYGVVKLDGRTMKEQDGKVHVDTSALDLVTQDTEGIGVGDGTTIKTTLGVLSVSTESLQKASTTSYGIAKTDGVTVKSDGGVLSVDMNGIDASVSSSGKKTLRADQTSVVSSNGVLSIDTTKLSKASSTSYGVAKIDTETLYITQDGSLKVKNYESMMSYIYDYEEGLGQLEERISYLQTLLSSGMYGSQEPEIRHLTCDQTTATELVPPTYMQEPINMETQHVYVSLNVITNCSFKITLDFQDDKNPTTQLDNINFNEEIQKFGVEALDYAWPSTGMKEKRIVLLFNVKNFLSSTEGQTTITKVRISVAPESDNTKEKSILYSIIRYNSAWKEDEPMINTPEVDKDEHYADERASRWYMIRVKPGENNEYYWDQISAFEDISVNDGGYVEKSGPIGGLDENVTILIDDVNKALGEDPEYVFYLKGVYVNRNTGIVKSFFERIPVENFIISTNLEDEILPRNVYDFEWKAGFDVLYFQIRYSINNPTSVQMREGASIADIYRYHPDYTYVDVPIEIGGDVINRYYITHSGAGDEWTTYTNGVRYAECICARLCDKWYDNIVIDGQNNIHLTNDDGKEFCMIDFERSKDLSDKISIKYNIDEIEDTIGITNTSSRATNYANNTGRLYFYIPTLKATLEERLTGTPDNNEAVVSRISALQKVQYHDMKYEVSGYVGISEVDGEVSGDNVNYVIPYGAYFAQNMYLHLEYKYSDNGEWTTIEDQSMYDNISYKILPVHFNVTDMNSSNTYSQEYSFNEGVEFTSQSSLGITQDYYGDDMLEDIELFKVSSTLSYGDAMLANRDIITTVSHASMPTLTVSNLNIYVDEGTLKIESTEEGTEFTKTGFTEITLMSGEQQYIESDLNERSICLSYSYSSRKYYNIEANDSFDQLSFTSAPGAPNGTFILRQHGIADPVMTEPVEESLLGYIDLDFQDNGYANAYTAFICSAYENNMNLISNVVSQIKKGVDVSLSSENSTYFIDSNNMLYTYSRVLQGDMEAPFDWMYDVDNTRRVLPGIEYAHSIDTQVMAYCAYDYSVQYEVSQTTIPSEDEVPIVTFSFKSSEYDQQTLTLNIGTVVNEYDPEYFAYMNIYAYFTPDAQDMPVIEGSIDVDGNDVYASFENAKPEEIDSFILTVYGEYVKNDMHIMYKTLIDEYAVTKVDEAIHIESISDTIKYIDSISIAIADTVNLFSNGTNTTLPNYDIPYDMLYKVYVYDNNDLENAVVEMTSEITGMTWVPLNEFSINEYEEDSVTIKVKFYTNEQTGGKYDNGVMIYNVPVVRGLGEKLGVTNYNGVVVPTFSGMFDSHFNPYDYSIDVKWHDIDDDNYIDSSLNDIIVQQTPINVIFDVKYKDYSIIEKTVLVQQVIDDQYIVENGTKIEMTAYEGTNDFYSYYYRLDDSMAVTQVEEHFTCNDIDFESISEGSSSCIIPIESDDIHIDIDRFMMGDTAAMIDINPDSVSSYILYSSEAADGMGVVWDRCSYEYGLGYQYMLGIAGFDSLESTPPIYHNYEVRRYTIDQNTINLETNQE